jgi:hypothetical protein
VSFAMLDIKDNVYADHLVLVGWMCIRNIANIFKHLILVVLGNITDKKIPPFYVTVLFINFPCVIVATGQFVFILVFISLLVQLMLGFVHLTKEFTFLSCHTFETFPA